MLSRRADQPYYLMDRRVVRSSAGVRLEACAPVKAGPVLTQEEPWERFYLHPHSLVDYGGEFLLYYTVYIVDDGPNHVATCLATSTDGLCWDRPELGQVEYAGTRCNNLLAVGGTVTIDPSAPPERRFLMTTSSACPQPGNAGPIVDGVALSTSPDGRTWTPASPALTPFTCDTNNQVLYDPAKGKYVAYLRAFPGRRAVAYYEPPDPFTAWPIRPAETNQGEVFTSSRGPERVVYLVDELPIAIDGDQRYQVYNPGVVLTEGLYLAFPDVFRVFPGPGHPEAARFPGCELYEWANDGLVAPGLYVSEDGARFRPVGESPYIDLGYGEELDTRQIRMVTGWIVRDDELWQYYGGHQTGHTLARGKRPRRRCAVMRVCQRRDGFAALTTGTGGGEITTALVFCVGGELLVNYDAGAWGQIQVELLDEDEQPVPQYAQVDAATLVGNAVYAPVRWSGQRDLRPLAGRRLSVRFRLRSARLFSFKFT